MTASSSVKSLVNIDTTLNMYVNGGGNVWVNIDHRGVRISSALVAPEMLRAMADEVAPAGSYTRTDEEGDPERAQSLVQERDELAEALDTTMGRAIKAERERDDWKRRAGTSAATSSRLSSELVDARARAEKAEQERDELWPFRKRAETIEQSLDAALAEAAMCQTSLSGQIRRAEQAEDALVEMTAHRDQCRDTAIKWQMEANRAVQPRALTPDAIESVLHDILPLTANRLGEDDVASIASDLYLALTAPARDPRAEEIQADLATAEEPEMDDEDRRLIADHLAALGYRKTP